MDHIMVFLVDDRQYGLPVHRVDRVVRLVEISQPPKLPAMFHGVINMQGKIIPVMNLRVAFDLKVREPELTDLLVICSSSEHPVAFIVDEVAGVQKCNKEDIVSGHDVLQEVDCVEAIVKQKNGMIIVVFDPDKLIAPQAIKVTENDRES